MKTFKTADEFYESDSKWRDELVMLRTIILETELVETVKWGIPVYTLEGKNVVGTGSFKSYFGIWFYQGVFLSDPEKVLINAQEGKTKAMRQWRMSSGDEIDKPSILNYVREAIQNQKEGKVVRPGKKKLSVPQELSALLELDSELRVAFEELTPGKQREYADFVGTAKQEQTRLRRTAKIKPMILKGLGLNDKYR